MNRRYHRSLWSLGLGLILAVAAIAVPQAADAQTAPASVNGGALRQMLLSRMSASGMTPDDVRKRLTELGYDPAMLNPYLEGTEAPAVASNEAIAAARALGALSSLEIPAAPTAPVTAAPSPSPQAIAAPLSAEEEQENLRVFGLDVFTGTGGPFQPMATGPVPGSYVLGPGDEIVLVITGDVEMAHTLPVTREGFIVVPQVGQIWVNGTTLDSFRDQMFTHLGRVYSGISRSPNATTRFDVSLGRLRTNQVFITGNVAQPGTYLLSPVASVLNGLYQAGGPTAMGSFRDVQILRGGRVVQHVDLYDYLLRGNNLDGIRLGPSDVIFVPPVGAQVALRGTVRREALYELKPDENLAHLLEFAGGINTAASLRRARIARVLPPSERRTPGIDRTVIDVDLAAALRNPADAPTLRDQDEVRIFPVRGEVRNTVALNGSVWHEGSFAFEPGMKAWDLIDLGQGLTPDAYLERAQISRLNLADSTVTLIPFSLKRGADGRPMENPDLREFDVVRVLSSIQRDESYTVGIAGAVQNAGTQRYEEGMTVKDLVLRAGGLTRAADLTIEISRIGSAEEREAGKIAEIIHVQVDSSYILSEDARRHYLGNPDAFSKSSGAAAIRLMPNDQVFVRRLPYLTLDRVIEVEGEVKYPGAYSLANKTDRVRDILIDRAGGLMPGAYREGISVVRDGKSIDVDFDEIMDNPRSVDNMVLQAGDRIVVPEYSPVVYVTGGVEFPTTVLYKAGADLDYYIENAGGYSRIADKDRVHVRYANGGGETIRKFLFFKDKPDPEPGSTITVPVVPVEEREAFDTRGMIRDITQIVGTVGAAVILILRAN